MAKYLKFDQDLYGIDGMIPLLRGDDWVLPGKIIDLNGANQSDVDLTGVDAIEAFFPATGAARIEVPVNVIDADCGKVSITVPASGSAVAQLSDSGVAPYIIINEGSQQHTITSVDVPLKIQDQNFNGP